MIIKNKFINNSNLSDRVLLGLMFFQMIQIISCILVNEAVYPLGISVALICIIQSIFISVWLGMRERDENQYDTYNKIAESYLWGGMFMSLISYLVCLLILPPKSTNLAIIAPFLLFWIGFISSIVTQMMAYSAKVSVKIRTYLNEKTSHAA